MTTYEMGKYWLLHTLESYRDTLPEEPRRKFIDRLIEGSRSATGDDPEEKRLHNLTVLRYIIDTRPAKQGICKALRIGRQNYEAVTAQAIDRLLILAFGMDGIDWDGSWNVLADARSDSEKGGNRNEHREHTCTC